MNIYSDDFVMKPIFACYDKAYNPIDALIYLQLRFEYDAIDELGTYDIEILSDDLKIEKQFIEESIQRLIEYKLIDHTVVDDRKGTFTLLKFNNGFPVPNQFLLGDLPTKMKAAYLANHEAETDEEFDRIARYYPDVDFLDDEQLRLNYQIRVLEWRIENLKIFLRAEIQKPGFDAEIYLAEMYLITDILITL